MMNIFPKNFQDGKEAIKTNKTHHTTKTNQTNHKKENTTHKQPSQ